MASEGLHADSSMPGPSVDSGNSPRSTINLHVLCPSLLPPNRFTFHDLPLSTSIAGLKGQITQSLPRNPSPENQRLIYRGKPLTSDVATLQSVLEPVEDSEYSLHLVLPPAPAPPVSGSSSTPTPTQDSGNTAQRNPFFSSTRFTPPNFTHTQTLRYRGPGAPTGQNDVDVEQELRRNIESIRRQLDAQRRSPFHRPASQEPVAATSATPFTSHTSPFPQTSAFAPINLPQVPASPFTMPTGTFPPNSIFRNPNVAEMDEVQPRLQAIRQEIESHESLLRRGIAPSIDLIIRIRNQLLGLLDDQVRIPNGPRESAIEHLLTRTLNVYSRADQVRVTQARSATPGSSSSESSSPSTRAPLYLLSGPNGYQSLVASPDGNNSIQASLTGLRAAQTPGPIPIPGRPVPDIQRPPNPANAAVLENVVRQAVINNNQRQGQLSLARSVRRIWLFARLYFFCYMFSEPGTWTRIFFVSLAAIMALLSETEAPQQLHRVIIAPIQQHLEGLVHFTPDHDLRPQNQAATTEPGNAHPTGLRHNFRRVERSLALFIASLVPGVGERHIEVRNAAEAAQNAERAREEERRRETEQAEQQPHENDNENEDAEAEQNEHEHEHEN